MPVALGGVARPVALLSIVIVTAACGASTRHVAPTSAAADPAGRIARIERAAARLHAVAALDAGLAGRSGMGAWSWPDGRVRVTPALVDALDADQLAAVLAHEAAHIRLGRTPGAVDGAPASEATERAADRLGCALLAQAGVDPGAMAAMLRTLARGTGRRLDERIARATRACARR
jgi:Zn-dependent protease with chaperone function